MGMTLTPTRHFAVESVSGESRLPAPAANSSAVLTRWPARTGLLPRMILPGRREAPQSDPLAGFRPTGVLRPSGERKPDPDDAPAGGTNRVTDRDCAPSSAAHTRILPEIANASCLRITTAGQTAQTKRGRLGRRPRSHRWRAILDGFVTAALAHRFEKSVTGGP